MLIPVVTAVLSTWLEDERITWAFVVGAALVLGGVYLGAIEPRRALPSSRA